MKLYFHKTGNQLIEYNIRLIEKLLAQWLVDDPRDADYIMLSLCDISEIGEIERAKKYGKPVITGGMVSEYPIINELSDYTWHGEIYGFRDAVKVGQSLDEMESITKRGDRRLKIDQGINWQENPIIHVGKRAMYYYVSKGCPVRCKYCYIGNVRDYQTCPESLYQNALRIAGARLMPIAAYNPYGTSNKTNIGETLLKRYITGKMGSGAKTLRGGVEFCTDDLSKNLAKGVTLDDLNAAILKSRVDRTRLIIYFIAGLEAQDVLEDYFNRIVQDYSIKYPVTIVMTYIDPQPFTPMHDLDLRHKISIIDHKRLYWIASQRNKRIRFMPLAGPEKSTIRTLLGRAVSLDDYRHIKSISKMNHTDMIRSCESKPHLIGNATLQDIMGRKRDQIVPEYWRAA